MKAQYENKVISSTLLWIDHTITSKGSGYTNHGSEFYSVGSQWNGYFAYGAPYKQFVSDHSIEPNAPIDPTVMSGIYIDGAFTTTGNSDFVDIDYSNGHVYFSSDQAGKTLSGDYAVKDFNIYLTNKTDQELLFETKVEIKPKTTTNPNGLETDMITYPAIFLKNLGGRNEPFAMGGLDETITSVRAIILADSQFNLDAACSILKDRVRTNIQLVEENDYPFNALGGYKSSVYNYTGLAANSSSHVFINDVYVSQFNVDYISEIKNANPDVYSAIVDLDLRSENRQPRA